MSWARSDDRHHSWTSVFRLVVGAFLVAVLIFGGTTWGQRGRGGRGAPNPDRAAQQAVEQAGRDVERIATGILEQVAQNKGLTRTDVADIREVLKETNRYKGLLSKEARVKYMMVEAYLAYYGGEDTDRALDLLNSARRMVSDNPDVNDSAIVLGLCYGDWALVKSVLREVGPSPAEAEVGAEAGSAAAREPRVDPNTTMGGFGRGRNGQPGQDASRSSKWGRPKKNERSMDFGVGRQLGPAAPMDPMFMTPADRPRPRTPRPRSSNRGGNESQQNTRLKGVLNLPVKHMPYEHLGDDFSQITVRNINGSYFQFVPAQGQLLCALMWQLADDDGGPARVVAQPSRGRRGSRAGWDSGPARAPERSETIDQVSYDLGGNARQFGELFAQGLASGKMQMVGVNTDSGYSAGEVVAYLLDNPAPWSTCMIDDPSNSGQWSLDSSVSPVMVLVDSAGKVRYMGPAGGFLPRMLLALELPKATGGGQAGQMPAMPTMPAGARGGAPEKRGLWDLLPERAGEESSAGSGAGAPEGAADAAVGSVEPLKAKVSNHQAQQMLKTARVQMKTNIMSPRSALRMCDEVLKRFPDTLEADEAKLMIKSMLSDRPQLKREREQLGKYVGG